MGVGAIGANSGVVCTTLPPPIEELVQYFEEVCGADNCIARSNAASFNWRRPARIQAHGAACTAESVPAMQDRNILSGEEINR
jgi:hypothetical protein